MDNNVIALSERRTLPRRSAEFTAYVDRAGREPLPCTVFDMTYGGARIHAQDTALPDRFTLLIEGGSFVRRSCRVVWRDEFTVGVAFLE